jgi:copper chaperone
MVRTGEGAIAMNTTKYQVTGMTCGHCEGAVTAEVSQIAGVAHVDVSAATGILVVTSTGELDDTQVFAAVEEAGYAAVRF